MGTRKTRKKLRIERIIFMFITLYFVVTFINQRNLKKNLESKRSEYETEIAKIEAEIEELEDEIENSDSLQFVEKIAREELGMVKPREIIVIDKNKKSKRLFNLNSPDN